MPNPSQELPIEMMPAQAPQVELPTGYFGEETPEEQPPQQPQMQEVPREPTSDEYQQALMSTLTQLIGPSLQDPKNLAAVSNK